MAAVFKSFGVLGLASLLLQLAALMATSAPADDVTTAECKADGRWQRVRQFPTDSTATALMMYSCGLSEINANSFTGLLNVESIVLSKNNIEYIDPATFHAVPTLTSLWLDQNKLDELPVFDEESCPSLTVLGLVGNQLTGISNPGTFSACAKLQLLYLGNNKIEFLHQNVFSRLTDLRVLDMYSNRLRFIPDNMFASNGKLRELYLYNNRLSHLPPEFASRLKRTSTGLVLFHFHNNPWQCACLLELLADVKRAGVNDYNAGFYAGTAPECDTDAGSCSRAEVGALAREIL